MLINNTYGLMDYNTNNKTKKSRISKNISYYIVTLTEI